MSTPDTTILGPRQPDCLAPFIDSPGDGIRNIPVCMGGTAIVGCTNVGECLKKFPADQQPPIALTVHEEKIVAVPLAWALKTILGTGNEESTETQVVVEKK